jgi:hypothetical protein
MQIHENAFYKGNARLCFTKTEIVTDRVDGIKFSNDMSISTWNFPTFNNTPTIRWRQFDGLSRFESENCWNFITFHGKILGDD